jgi:LysM repeat protein
MDRSTRGNKRERRSFTVLCATRFRSSWLAARPPTLRYRDTFRGGVNMGEDRFVMLKAKYQTVLNKIQQLGVTLENLHVQDNKLVIRGHAKTKAESDEVWNQIKLVDPGYEKDLAAEITFNTDAAAAAPQARTYTVKHGDTLSDIAQRVYGRPSEYHKIFEANRDQLSDPDRIKPGQVLRLPA